MKYELAQKAYTINLSKIDEGNCWEEIVVHAETRGKAQSLLYKRADSEGMALLDTGDYVTYKTTPVVRCKAHDAYHFEGHLKSINEIEYILEERVRIERLDRVLADQVIKYCYIKKGNYYRPNHCGYTDYQSRAGVYTKEEAVSSAKRCDQLTIVPINIVAHNSMITDAIDDLNTRILK